MAKKPRQAWPLQTICLTAERLDHGLARLIYQRSCRVDFDEPGFCAVNCGSRWDSLAFRRLMVELKNALSDLHLSAASVPLVAVTANRFDQQTSTKPHRDGGPDESLLLLGYEPSAVASELDVIDYSRCARDRGVSPAELLRQHNPLFSEGRQVLVPYTHRVACFSPADYQIVCINNSCVPFSTSRFAWQGTLHTATVPQPDDTQRRIINSLQITPATDSAAALSEEALNDFATTKRVRRRGYDRPELADDE